MYASDCLVSGVSSDLWQDAARIRTRRTEVLTSLLKSQRCGARLIGLIITGGLAHLVCAREASHRVRHPHSTRRSSLDLFYDVLSNEAIHRIHYTQSVSPFFFLHFSLDFNRWRPIRPDIAAAWPNGEVSRVEPHIESATIARWLATAYVSISLHKIATDRNRNAPVSILQHGHEA